MIQEQKRLLKVIKPAAYKNDAELTKAIQK